MCYFEIEPVFYCQLGPELGRFNSKFVYRASAPGCGYQYEKYMYATLTYSHPPSSIKFEKMLLIILGAVGVGECHQW